MYWYTQQYIPRIIKTDTRLHYGIPYNKMVCRRFGLSTFRFVDVVSVCRRFGVSKFWFVDVLVCRRFGLSTFRFVDVTVCRRFGLSTFWSVDVSVCRRFGLSTFWLSTFRFVDVLTSYHPKMWPRDDPVKTGCEKKGVWKNEFRETIKVILQYPLLLTWIDVNPSTDR